VLSISPSSEFLPAFCWWIWEKLIGVINFLTVFAFPFAIHVNPSTSNTHTSLLWYFWNYLLHFDRLKV
jgi:hypothetical protein